MKESLTLLEIPSTSKVCWGFSGSLRAASTFYFGLIFCLIISGCSLFNAKEDAGPDFSPREQLYFAEFDDVWRATQIALQKYPMYVNNMDRGVLETEVIKGYNVWTPPHKPNMASGGMRYKLSVRVIKGRLQGRSAIKVTVTKDMEIQKDFFSPVRRLPTDGLEEKSILYRVERELQIDKALQKAQKKINN